MICLDPSILEKLSSKGVLAYVAASLAGDAEATTASLAALVKAQTAAMREGLHELSVTAPGLVARVSETKWRCGRQGAEGAVQMLDSDRYRAFVDDLKKYWEYLNPAMPFCMAGQDGAAMQRFLRAHPAWTREDWLKALRHRAVSVIRYGNASRTEAFSRWVGRLGDYLAEPLNEYNRPAETAGKHGQAVRVRQGNREAVLAAVAHA